MQDYMEREEMEREDGCHAKLTRACTRDDYESPTATSRSLRQRPRQRDGHQSARVAGVLSAWRAVAAWGAPLINPELARQLKHLSPLARGVGAVLSGAWGHRTLGACALKQLAAEELAAEAPLATELAAQPPAISVREGGGGGERVGVRVGGERGAVLVWARVRRRRIVERPRLHARAFKLFGIARGWARSAGGAAARGRRRLR